MATFPSIFDLAVGMLRRLPGGEFAERQLTALEHQMLGELKRRLETLDGTRPTAEETPQSLLRALLETSMDQSREQSQTTYFVAILKSLMPDEARILAALSDGSAYPLIHVAEGSLVGAAGRRELENVSSIGRAAGVLWLDMVPSYVGRLRALGLVETGPEDETAEVKYEMLETDNAVRQTIERIARTSRQKPRIVRRTLRLSPLGRALWAACRMDE